MEDKIKILGIDPGLQVCGYAVIEKNAAGNIKLLEAGVFRTDGKRPLAERLVQIQQDVNCIIEKYRPDFIAVEELYSHYAHPKTAILMGHARGVILACGCCGRAKVISFAATKIKKSLTGSGRAAKSQMQMAVKTILNLAKLPQPPDVADAIAAALCCANAKC